MVSHSFTRELLSWGLILLFIHVCWEVAKSDADVISAQLVLSGSRAEFEVCKDWLPEGLLLMKVWRKPEGCRGSTSRGTYLEIIPWGWELNGFPKVENSISSGTQGLPAHHSELYKAWMYSLPTSLLIYRWALGIFYLVSKTSHFLDLNTCKNDPFTHSFNKYSQNVYRILYMIY